MKSVKSADPLISLTSGLNSVNPSNTPKTQATVLERGRQQVRTYADHLGHRVVLEQFVVPDNPLHPNDLLPIQVYSLVPLEDDHYQLRMYLMQSFFDEEVKPLFEIYPYCPPDALACIEHNRLEIARRK